jgi:hypothetical protein
MPKVYKNKKKFIDPRYFLNETTQRDLILEQGIMPGDRIGNIPSISDLKKYKDTICNNKDMFLTAIDMLEPKMASKMILSQIPGLSEVPQAENVITMMLKIYQGNEQAKTLIKTTVEGFCLVNKLPFKLPF